MSIINFRRCTAEDVTVAVPLIYSSGPAAFNYVFCTQHANEAQDFLRDAFIAGDSEFGYKQHYAMVLDGKVVGIGGIKTAAQSLSFSFAAFKAIWRFYGFKRTWGVVLRGLRTEAVICPPKSGVGMIYELGVAPEHRNKGLGRQLIAYLLDQIKRQNLPIAALDVAVSNPKAQRLYERLGFIAKKQRSGKLTSAFGEVVDHIYMELPL